MFTDNYRVLFEDYSERHYIKAFKKDYGNQWLITRKALDCPSSRAFAGCQDLVRFLALRRIKPHAPPLVRVPVNSFEFHTCVRTPQVDYLSRLLGR